MDLNAIKKAYRRYARYYDFYFGAVLQPGRKAVIEKMGCQSGDRILEVGVGTGLSIPLYPRDVLVTGVDISQEMLLRAQNRSRRDHLKHVTGFVRGDAENLCFANASFDKVVAMYVATVVPSPARLVKEMRRVCKPDGEIFIVNHFHHTNPVIGGVERMIAPMSRVLGFRPDVGLNQFIEETRLDVVERTRVNAFGYWTLLRAQQSNQRFSRSFASEHGIYGKSQRFAD